MDYAFLDKSEYREVPLFRIEDNCNGLPFFVARIDRCALSKHRHEYVQIVYVSRGKLKHVINSNTFDVYTGDIFIIPPYVPHYFIDEYGGKFELIEFEFIPEFINEKFSLSEGACSFFDFAYLEPFLVSESDIKPRLNLTGGIKLEAESMFNEIIREYEVKECDFQLVIKALLLKLLILVGREFKKDINGSESQNLFKRHRDAMYNAVGYIGKNYCEAITVEETAKVAMLSNSYFRYLFKQMTGKTFVEYVNNLRITRAIELLKTKQDMKVVDISCEVGFNNVNHFNRSFRQETGVTPMKYRKMKG